jgi:hypothetical protein
MTLAVPAGIDNRQISDLALSVLNLVDPELAGFEIPVPGGLLNLCDIHPSGLWLPHNLAGRLERDFPLSVTS